MPLTKGRLLPDQVPNVQDCDNELTMYLLSLPTISLS